MDPLVVILLAIVVVALVGWYLSTKKNKEKPRRPGSADPFSSADDDATRGNPRTLKPGDIVTVRNQDYTVRGLLRLTEGSYNWNEAFLDTGVGDRMWLSVEDDPDLEVVLWREQKNVTVTPGPKTIELDGCSYSSDESGQATFISEGTTGLAAQGTMRYHDYESDGNLRLSFEDFSDGKWECARGELLLRSEYTIYSLGSE